jgi:phosphoenolpyruvate phosphomutase
MVISSTVPLPEKDFKAVINDWVIKKIWIEFFENAVMAMPLYKLNKKDWMIWLDNIMKFCEQWVTNVYAENAFNEISDSCKITTFDIKDGFCTEIDNQEDLKLVKNKLLLLK